jgi:hypothetical protein
MPRNVRFASLTALCFVAGLPLGSSLAGASDDPVGRKAQGMIDKGLAYLQTQQKPDGSWQNEKEPPALTAIVLKAFAQNSKHGAHPDFVKKGYDRLLTYQLEDGGIYKDTLANYNTAIAVSALIAAENPAYRDRIDKAVAYLKGLQWTDKTKFEHPDQAKRPLVAGEADPFYGGWGYGGVSGGGSRPDLSNAQMTLEALKEAGLKENDPAFQAALKFVTRLQRLTPPSGPATTAASSTRPAATARARAWPAN